MNRATTWQIRSTRHRQQGFGFYIYIFGVSCFFFFVFFFFFYLFISLVGGLTERFESFALKDVGDGHLRASKRANEQEGEGKRACRKGRKGGGEGRRG